MVRPIRRAEAVLLWPRVVGPEVARFTRARSLKGGVLFVEVPDSETSMHLGMQRMRFLEAYRERFGVKEVKEIRFRVGFRSEGEADTAAAPGAGGEGREETADPEDWPRLARAIGGLELPEGVAAPTLAAARAWARFRSRKRAEGWQPCPHCGALSPGNEPCAACARYRASARVQRAAQRLAVDPLADTPTLADEERAVARALALERLDDDLLELLPQAVSDPRLRDQLEAVARCRLALELEVAPGALTDEDWQRLDTRVARALGRYR